MKYSQVFTLAALFGLANVNAIKLAGRGQIDIDTGADIDADTNIDIEIKLRIQKHDGIVDEALIVL